MKLLHKSIRRLIIASILAVFVGASISYFFLKKIMNDEVNENLQKTRSRIENFVEKEHRFPETELFVSDSIGFVKTDSHIIPSIKEVKLYDSIEEETLPFKISDFGVNIQNQNYRVTIIKPLYETEDMQEALVLNFFLVLIFLMAFLIITNIVYEKKLWRPFYQMIAELRNFEIGQKEKPSFGSSNIDEFENLKKELDQLTSKVQKDFRTLKTFSENASHELQTPLAVLRSNLELMLGDDLLNENQMTQISKALETIGRMSKLNQTLLLLTKIDNGQYTNNERVNVSDVVIKKITEMNLWITHKNLEVRTNIQPNIYINLSPFLLDILINNLLSNAIKHNLPDGFLEINLDTNQIQISNSGLADVGNPTEMFERFKKGKNRHDSHGLGLSLVKEICNIAGYIVLYTIDNKIHTITIKFSKK